MIRIFLSLLLVLLAIVSLTGTIDDKSREYTDESLSRALVAFAAARGLNGVISVAQGTEMAFQPAGVGITITPGQVLDPINDLVERFSGVMLTAAASIGIQEVLINIGSSKPFSYLVSLFCIGTLILIWQPKICAWRSSQIFLTTAIIFIFIRFAVPVLAISGAWIFNTFLEPQFNEAKAALEEITVNISTINENSQPLSIEQDPSLLDQAKNLFSSATSVFDFEQQAEQYSVAAESASKHTITLIVVFVIHTILLPIGYLTGVRWLGQMILKYRIDHYQKHNQSKKVF